MKKYLSVFVTGITLTLLAGAVFAADSFKPENIGMKTEPMKIALAQSAQPTGGDLESAQLRSDFSIMLDGKKVYFKSADGSAAYPILYEDSTYLPLRAVGELMGKNVNWDEYNKVINISGKRESDSSVSVNKSIGIQQIFVQERPDFTIRVDNRLKEFYSASGQRIYPILYNGSTYLPLRSIGEIMGRDVLWDSVSKTVNLKNKNGLTVTDADSFNSNNSNSNKPKPPVYEGTGNGIINDVINNNINAYVPKDNNSVNAEINMDKAKNIALNHAGFSATQVTFTKTKVDFENGVKCYEIEFYADSAEYEYEIDALTGQVLTALRSKEKQPQKPQASITIEEAKSIALKHAGVSASDAVFKKTKQDYDDGRYIYEIEFNVGRTEYEYEIDAETGQILEYESEYDD